MIHFEKIDFGYERSISIPVVYPEESGMDVERFIFSLDPDQSKVLALRGLGFQTDEIVKILGIPTRGMYYKIVRSIQLLYKANNISESGV